MAKVALPYFEVGEQLYSVSPDPVASLSCHTCQTLAHFDRYLIPTTVITSEDGNFGEEELNQVCQEFSAKDDVWSRNFLSSECGQQGCNP